MDFPFSVAVSDFGTMMLASGIFNELDAAVPPTDVVSRCRDVGLLEGPMS